MNRFEVYVWIDGAHFDAEGFQHSLDAHMSGTVKTTKRIRNGTVEQGGRYWQSEVRTPVEEEPEEALATLLVHYRAAILRARALHATRIMAEIVEYYDTIDEVRGFYLAEETLRLLAELGVSLDIDIVRRLV